MSEPWTRRTAGAVADVIVSSVDKKTRKDHVPVRLCNYTDVYRNDFIRPEMNLMTATGLYQVRKMRREKKVWEERKSANRFDPIINTPFAIKSHHSSFVQVADAIAYVYRRKLELASDVEAWTGERKYQSRGRRGGRRRLVTPTHARLMGWNGSCP